MKSSVAHKALRWEGSLRIYFWFILKAWWHFKAPKFGALGVWEEKKLPSSTVQNQHFVDGWLILWIIILESKKYIPRSSAHWLQLQSISANWALQRHCYQNHGSGGIWVSLANGIHQGHTETKQHGWHGATLASGSSSRAVVLNVLLWCHVRTPQTCTFLVPSQTYGIRIARHGSQEAVSTCFPGGFFALRITALENAQSENSFHLQAQKFSEPHRFLFRKHLSKKKHRP